jgi:hypothetical protein
LIGLQDGGVGRDDHRLAHLTDFERRVDAAHGAGFNADAGAHEFAEAVERGFHAVVAGLQVRDRVSANIVGDRRADEAGAGVRHRDGDARQRGAAGVADRADDRAVHGLRVHGM